MGLNDFSFLNSNSKAKSIILLIITFTKGTGDLRIEVPAIPEKK